MQARAWYQAGFAAPWLAVVVVAPAYADWGYDYGRAFMGAFARQAARQVIIYELKKLNSSQRSNSAATSKGYGSTDHQSNYGGSDPYRSHSHTASSGTSHSNHTSANHDDGSGLRYPTEQRFVPPPPPSPVLYPPSPIASASKSKTSSTNPQLVPPPPPAPSVWDDSSTGEPAPVVSKQ